MDEVLTAEFVVPFSAEVHCTFNYMDVTETKSLDAEDIYEAGKTLNTEDKPIPYTNRAKTKALALVQMTT